MKGLFTIVADPNDKFEDNVEGYYLFEGKKISFYVDRECIFCNVCVQAAPSNFALSDNESHDYVYKQPQNEEELDECYDALEQCPVEAIGDDGYE